MPNHLDYHYLLGLGACRDQVQLFRRTFGDGAVPITVAHVAEARAVGLDVTFLAGALSAPALAEYDPVCDAARAEYYRVCAPALAEYARVCDAALVAALNAEESDG